MMNPLENLLFGVEFLATACSARRGLSHHLTVIELYVHIYIYLFVQCVNIFFKTLLLSKYWADFNETQFKLFLRSLRILVVVVYAYIAYISKVMTAYILPFNHNSLYCHRLCCDHVIMTSQSKLLCCGGFLWTDFTHHNTSIIKYICTFIIIIWLLQNHLTILRL